MRILIVKYRTFSTSIFSYSKFLLLLISWLVVQQAKAQTLSWVNGLGSSEDFEQGDRILTDQAGNIYISGQFSGTVDFDFSSNTTALTAQGGDDAFFAKYNAKRELQWVKSISGSGFESIARMTLDQAGNLYIIGGFEKMADFDSGPQTRILTSAGSDDGFLAKYNNNGEYQWAFTIGGTQSESGGNVVLDNAGSVYITGILRKSDMPVDFDPGTGTKNLNAVGVSASIYMAKYTSDGAYQWAFIVGAPTEFKNLADFDLVLNQATNELVLAGRLEGVADFDPGNNTVSLDEADGGAFIAKYSTDGNYILAKNFGSLDARSLVLDKVGNIYVCGSYSGTDVDFDPGANTVSLTSKGDEDWFIGKYNSAIELQWVKGLGAIYNDFPESIALDSSDNVYVAGNFDEELSFNDPANTTKIQSKGSTDGLLVSYDKEGNYRFAYNIGGSDFDTVNDVFINQDINAIYLIGSYTNMAEFAINNGSSTTLTSQGKEDIFFALYGDAPEIAIALNKRNIASGTTLDFRNISVGSSSADSTITIENKSIVDLKLSGTAGNLVALSGVNANDFTVIQTGVTSPISAGSQVTFTVSYTPNKAGPSSALLTIQSNDNNESTYTIQLAGTGVNNVTSVSEQVTDLLWTAGPNPTSEYIKVSNSEYTSQYIHYQVLDQKGKVILSSSGKLESGTLVIDLNQVPKGHYLLRLQVEDKQVIKRIVKY